MTHYWARHTYATMSVNKGASLEFMREALGHSHLKTTMIYAKVVQNKVSSDMSNIKTKFIEHSQNESSSF